MAVVSKSDSELANFCDVLTSSVVWGARTWAVCDRNRYVLGFFGSIGLAIIILDVVSTTMAGAHGVCLTPDLRFQIHVPFNSCKGNNSIPM
jgi:hypothetical protein